MAKKVIRISVISGVLAFALSSCSQSYFQILTHNDVAYWRLEGFHLFSSYSKRDSTFKDFDENMKYIAYQWASLEMCEHKFRVSNDTIYLYHRSKETGKCYPENTFQIISYKKNRLEVKRIPTEQEIRDSIIQVPSHWLRVNDRDIKRIREGKEVRFKDCENYKIEVIFIGIDKKQ